MKKRPAADLKTRRDLAALLGVNPATVQSWTEMGMPVAQRGGKGRPSLFDQAAVQAWLDARDEKAKEAIAGSLNPAQERARRDRWTARLARQTYLVRKRVLLPADEVMKEVGSRIAAARAKFLSVPTSYADRIHRVATLEHVPGVERLLREMVREVLRELTDLRPHGKPAPTPKAPKDRSGRRRQAEAAA